MSGEKLKWFIIIYCICAPLACLFMGGFAHFFVYLFLLAIFIAFWCKRNIPNAEERKRYEEFQAELEEEERIEYEKWRECYKLEDCAPTSDAIARAFTVREKIRDGDYYGGTLGEDWIQTYKKYYEEFKQLYPDDIRKARFSAADKTNHDMVVKYWVPEEKRYKKDKFHYYTMIGIFHDAANEVYGIEPRELYRKFDPQNKANEYSMYPNDYYVDSPVHNAGFNQLFFYSGIENPILPFFVTYDKETPYSTEGMVHENIKPNSSEHNFYCDRNTALVKRAEFNMDTYILWQRGLMSVVMREPLYGDKVSDVEGVKTSDRVLELRKERVEVANILTDRDWTYDDYMHWMHTMDDIYGEDRVSWTVFVNKKGVPISGDPENVMIKYNMINENWEYF